MTTSFIELCNDAALDRTALTGHDVHMSDPRWLYRQIIDAMVVECAQGQGQVSAHRVRAGVWNVDAEEDPDSLPDQHTINQILRKLDSQERELLARLIADEFSSGVFNALNVLHVAAVAPFQLGYDGTPTDDFLGRLEGLDWPQSTA